MGIEILFPSHTQFVPFMPKQPEHRYLTLDELCRLLGISKATYYKARRQGAFPEPQRSASNRPVFDPELVEIHQQVVRSRVGVNGLVIIFKATAHDEPKKKGSSTPRHDNLMVALSSLGLSPSRAEVDKAVAGLPNAGDMTEEALIRAVFLALRRGA